MQRRKFVQQSLLAGGALFTTSLAKAFDRKRLFCMHDNKPFQFKLWHTRWHV